MDQSLQGCLLIAMPSLHDPNFFHSVVLLCRHDEEGAMGVIINRPLRATVRQVWKQISQNACDCDEPLYQGGPCPGPVMAIHTLPDDADAPVTAGIYLTINGDAIQSFVNRKMNAIKYFVGNAGWSAGQLEEEIRAASWLVAQATAEEVFHAGEDQWLTLSRAISLRASGQQFNPGSIPSDPSMN
jgi:putative transcriptional regulator